MLVLSRRLNETVVFPAINAAVRILSVKGCAVRLGIDAPREVAVLRGELQEAATLTTALPAKASPVLPVHCVGKIHLRFDEGFEDIGKGLGLVQLLLEAGNVGDAKELLAQVRENLQSVRQREKNGSGPAPKKGPKAANRGLKALLVEDDRNQRELLAGFLRAAGLRIDTAGDGSDALDYLRSQERPDVVLLDMTMPRCDGATTVRHIREDPAYAGLRIFAVTGSSPDQFDLADGPTGIDRWFKKPINPSELLHNLTEEICGV